MITVLFFAQLGETAGGREHLVKAPATQLTVDALARQVAAELPAALHADLFDGTVLVAVNKKRADWNTLVGAGDEVAFLPPVSGG